MKNAWPVCVAAVLLFVASCGPVIRQDLMDSGTREVPLPEMSAAPVSFEGRLFILGGRIVKIEVTDTGSPAIEAVYFPVNSNGYIIRKNNSNARYLALFSQDGKRLNPKTYEEKRYVTIAGLFTGLKTVKVRGAEYKYPVFEIKDIYLWPIERELPVFYNFGGAEHSF